MAGKAFSNAYISVNGTALSGDADTVTVESTLDSADVTAFGATNTVIAPTLGDAKITAGFFTDWRSGGPNEVLKAMHVNSRAGVPGTVEVWPVNSTPSATNPRISMVAYLMNYTALDASVGDASKFDAEFTNAGTAGITFGTS